MLLCRPSGGTCPHLSPSTSSGQAKIQSFDELTINLKIARPSGIGRFLFFPNFFGDFGNSLKLFFFVTNFLMFLFLILRSGGLINQVQESLFEKKLNFLIPRLPLLNYIFQLIPYSFSNRFFLFLIS